MSIQAPRIGIVDTCCPAPYGLGVLATRPLGGTEATVLKIVHALQGKFRFSLFQRNAPTSNGSGGCAMHPLDKAFEDQSCQAFLVINSWKVACRLRRFHPQAPIAVWLHVHPGRHNRQMGAALAKANIDVICVSDSQARQLSDFFGSGPQPEISYIHNPIADDLVPDDTPRNPDRLFFCSSPHKGLRQVFRQFAALRERFPKLTLEVADPGYLSWDTGKIPEGVWLRGSLAHDRLIARMRRALCLFYPQDSFAETFGLVIAEANAVGTPVLVQRGLGANDEVVSGDDQLIDSTDLDQLSARIRQWQTEFPSVQCQPCFRLGYVSARWQQRLESMLSGAASHNPTTGPAHRNTTLFSEFRGPKFAKNYVKTNRLRHDGEGKRYFKEFQCK